MMQTSLQENVHSVQARIAQAANGRDVKLIAVSKTMPAERLAEAYEAGLRTFGENRIQEALPKIEKLQNDNIEWHFIGHLQSNKAREAVRNFSWIQSIDSIKLMERVEQEAAKLQKAISLLLEVNLGGEETKYGFTRDQLETALQKGKSLNYGRIRGFMVIPPYIEDTEKVRPYFRELRQIQQDFLLSYPELTEVSMGMSHDFPVAIEEGATMVRVGTAIFGERP